MTHTNHRQGSLDSLSRDYVVFIVGARGINNKGIEPKLQKFFQLSLSCGAINAGTGPGERSGNMFSLTHEQLVEQVSKTNSTYAVFDDSRKAKDLVEELITADLGLSIVISGLFKEVDQICRTTGIKRHTSLYSLGIWGKVERLPEQEVLDITTMCGHSMIASSLVRRMAAEVKRGSISIDKAAKFLARPCICGVFNPKRAELLIRQNIENGK